MLFRVTLVEALRPAVRAHAADGSVCRSRIIATLVFVLFGVLAACARPGQQPFSPTYTQNEAQNLFEDAFSHIQQRFYDISVGLAS